MNAALMIFLLVVDVWICTKAADRYVLTVQIFHSAQLIRSQLAMQEAGCYEKFREFGRDGPFTIHQCWDHKGNKSFSWGRGEDQPELDREQIKQALLTTIPEEKIQWKKGVESSARDEKGNIVLSFKDGTIATGFKLVVGADGAFSQIRHLVCPLITRVNIH
jgi:2-polyprenyl-6-methoxyphenol hydroxylase-like FAD-dependent oxidoreductase